MSETVTSPYLISRNELDHHLEVLSLCIEEIGFESDRRISRNLIRESLEQACASDDDSSEIDSFMWVHDALHSLGLSDQLVDCTVKQLLEMAEDGAQIIAYHNDRDWIATIKSSRGKILVSGVGSKKTAKWISKSELQEVLEKYVNERIVRCVVVSPGVSIVDTSAIRHLTPLNRLWGLMKPEWPDIWIIIVFALVNGLLLLATPIAVETLVNTVAFGRFLQPVIIISLMLLVFLIFSAALRALQAFIAEIIQRRLFARVAADLAHRLPHVQMEAVEGSSTRELVNRFFDIVVVQKVASQFLLDGISLILGALIGMAMLAFYHPWLLGYDFILLLMLAIIIFILGRGAVETSIKESKVKYKMASWFEDIAGCPNTFRYEGSTRFALEHADHLISEYLIARGRHFRILIRQVIFALGVQAVASAGLLGLGGWLVITKQLTLGQLVAAELIVAVIVGAFAKLGKHMESFYDILASVDKLGVLFDLQLERQDGLIHVPNDESEYVEIQNLDYEFPKGNIIINDFSLTIEPEDRIAVVGNTGSGKSKLLDLLFGVRQPTHGHIKMMGAEIREYRPEALRRYVSLIRDIEIFEGTLSENIRVGRVNVTPDDVRKTLENVGLLEGVLCLPEQLDTMLSSTGYPLSNIQRHQLMVARACAGKPSLLLLDRTLDVMPDQMAEDLLDWLVQPEHPWKLVLVTGRQILIEKCNRKIDLSV